MDVIVEELEILDFKVHPATIFDLRGARRRLTTSSSTTADDGESAHNKNTDVNSDSEFHGDITGAAITTTVAVVIVIVFLTLLVCFCVCLCVYCRRRKARLSESGNKPELTSAYDSPVPSTSMLGARYCGAELPRDNRRCSVTDVHNASGDARYGTGGSSRGLEAAEVEVRKDSSPLVSEPNCPSADSSGSKSEKATVLVRLDSKGSSMLGVDGGEAKTNEQPLGKHCDGADTKPCNPSDVSPDPQVPDRWQLAGGSSEEGGMPRRASLLAAARGLNWSRSRGKVMQGSEEDLPDTSRASPERFHVTVFDEDPSRRGTDSASRSGRGARPGPWLWKPPRPELRSLRSLSPTRQHEADTLGKSLRTTRTAPASPTACNKDSPLQDGRSASFIPDAKVHDRSTTSLGNGRVEIGVPTAIVHSCTRGNFLDIPPPQPKPLVRPKHGSCRLSRRAMLLQTHSSFSFSSWDEDENARAATTPRWLADRTGSDRNILFDASSQ